LRFSPDSVRHAKCRFGRSLKMLRLRSEIYAFGLLLCCGMVLFSGCTGKPGDFIFTYAQEQPTGSLRGQSMEFFKSELEKRTDGRIQVELYHGGVLGTERELMDFAALGAIQGTRGGLFADANPKYRLLTLPFLVADWDEAVRLVNSPFMQQINAGARERGWHIPACGISQGFRAHTNSVRPIESPDDLRGLRMRVPPQEVFVKTALMLSGNQWFSWRPMRRRAQVESRRVRFKVPGMNQRHTVGAARPGVTRPGAGRDRSGLVAAGEVIVGLHFLQP